MKRLKFIIILVMLLLKVNIVDAASFTVSVSSKNLSKGSTAKLTIKGSDVTGRFNISSSNGSVVSISEDRAWIENDSYTIKLNALSVGTSTITISPSGVSDGSGNKVSLSAKTIKITVSLPREKSTDNNLKSLSIEGYNLEPTFNKDILDYEVTVPEGTKTIKINANANSSYASLSGTGEKEVTAGINNFNILVKSESGSEKIYNIVVNVIDEFPITVKVNDKEYTVVKLRENYTCKELFQESEIVINNIPIPSCSNKYIEYNLVGLKDSEGNIKSFIYNNGKYEKYEEINGKSIKLINEKYDGIIEGLTESTLEIAGSSYQAFKFNENSKYYVIYGTNIETGEKGLYLYDEVNNTFSGYDEEYINYLKEQNEVYLYVIIAFGSGLFLSIICIIILLSKKSNKKKKRKNKEEIKDINNEIKNDTNEIKEEERIDEVIETEEVKDVLNIENSEEYNLFETKKNKKHKKK